MADHKDAIGELLNSAEKVISAYDPSDAVKHDANVAKIMKFNAAHLEATAEYLGFTVKDTADKKLYKNLPMLADRIVLKTESFLPHIATCATRIIVLDSKMLH